MTLDAMLHIKIDPSMAQELKSIAKKRKTTMSELVRLAIYASYSIDLLGLPLSQKNALAAYRGGFISIGKLAEVMGMHVLELRQWLNENNIPQSNSYTRNRD